MNMSFASIQEKSTDRKFPMNGKLTNVGNIHSIAILDGLLIINYEDNQYRMNEVQFRLDNIFHVFIS